MAHNHASVATRLSNRYTLAALALFSCFLWGTAIPLIKTGYNVLEIQDSASQILFAGIRFAAAGLMVLAAACFMKPAGAASSASGKALRANPEAAGQSRLPAGKLELAAGRPRSVISLTSDMILPIIILGMTQTVGQYVFSYIAAAHVSGVKGSIINGIGSFFVILTSCLIVRHEPMTRHKAVGSLLGVSGVVLVNLLGSKLDFGFHLLGEGFYFISAMMYSFSTIMIRVFSRRINPVALSGYQFTFGGLVMIVIGLAFGGHVDLTTLKGDLILLELALVSAISYTVWTILLKYNPVSKVAIYGFTIPVFGVIISAIILKEADHLLNIGTIASLALVCVGIFVVNREDK